MEPNGVEPVSPAAGQAGVETARAAPRASEPESAAKFPAVGYAIRGKVMSGGSPVRGDDPQQWLSVTVGAADLARRCEIDEQGGFECTRLPAGSYVVSVGDQRTPHRLVCRPVEVRLNAEAPSAQVTLTLGEQVPVAVMVLQGENIEPVRDCRVTAELTDGPGAAASTTDAQGCCILDLIPGRYRIRAARGEESSWRVVVVPPSATGLAVDIRVPAPTARTIRGVLVDSQGNRVKGRVDLDVLGHLPTVEPNDSFSIPEPRNHHASGVVGYAYDVSGDLARRFLWRQYAPDEELVVTLGPRAGIVGRVVDRDGEPVPEARVQLQTVQADGSWYANPSLGKLTVDGAGGFRFEGLATGLPVRVTVHVGEPAVSAQSEPLDLKPGETRNIGEIVVIWPQKLDGVVSGRIVDEAGEPIADRDIRIWAGSGSVLGTDPNGRYTVSGLPTDEPVTVVVEVPGYGKWSRQAAAGDVDCDFQVYPSGWGLVGQEAPPLAVDAWINHVPVTLEELRGYVVLLVLCGWNEDQRANEAMWSAVGAVEREYGAAGLVTVIVYGRAPADRAMATGLAQYLLSRIEGLPIAGCFDADPNSIADAAPVARPAAAMDGATHRLYRVSARPALFLIDRRGTIRGCADVRDLRDRVQSLVAE